jgi:hypothetical protein
MEGGRAVSLTVIFRVVVKSLKAIVKVAFLISIGSDAKRGNSRALIISRCGSAR